LPQQTVTQVLFNSDSRVVYTVSGLGRTAIVSSPIAPGQPTADDVSRPISLDDRFRLAY
jgi:hypothetical protein